MKKVERIERIIERDREINEIVDRLREEGKQYHAKVWIESCLGEIVGVGIMFIDKEGDYIVFNTKGARMLRDLRAFKF